MLVELLFVHVFLCHFLSAVDELERIFRVSESVPAGHSVGFIHGQPTENHSKQNFFIVFPPTIDGKDNGAAEKLLTVDERTGQVTLRHGQSLDFEREQKLYVLAIPVDGSTPVSVVIEVQDENDNAPQFPVGTLQLEVSEYARINTVLGLPLARDADAAPFDVQRYRIASGNVNNAFRLAHGTAQTASNRKELGLVVNGRLDREYRSSYELLIEAIDGGRPAKVGSMRVHIEVLDANDNHPEFVQPRYSARISPHTAPGIPILRVGAKDPDAGDNGRVEYGIVSQSVVGHLPIRPSLPPAPFQLDAQTGTISLGQPLPTLSYSITFDLLIIARDHGVPHSLESSTTVEVIVHGTNDYIDDNTSNAISLSVIWLTDDGTGENLPEGLPLGYVLARVAIERSPFNRDADEHNAKDQPKYVPEDDLNLSLLGAQSMVCLRETDTEQIYLLIVCGQFDREQMPTLHMDLLVRNISDVLLDYPLRLTLLDINDNAPRWNQSHFQLQWILGILDPIEKQQQNDDAIAPSNGMPLSANMADNYANYVRIVATDADTGENGRIRYSTIGTDLFSIEPELGILTMDEDKLLNCPLDLSASFQVQAEDHGHPSPLRSRANVTVRFVYAQPTAAQKRVNFAQSVYEVRVAEDAQPGTCIAQLSALNDGFCGERNGSTSAAVSPGTAAAEPATVDGSAHDDHRHHNYHYWLEDDGWSELFKLDTHSGMLCTKKALDVGRHGQSIQLTVMVNGTDDDEDEDGTVADAQVVVHVEDANTHSPIFQPSKYALHLSPHSLQAKVPLLRVRAVDLDNSPFADGSSVFGKIHFRLGEGVGTTLFEINEFDGTLRLTEAGLHKLSSAASDTAAAERGAESSPYGLTLRVTAEDGAGRVSEQMALINVRLLAPQFRCASFAEPISHFRVSEETLPGIGIGTLRLVDDDDALSDHLADGVQLELVDDSDSARLFKFDDTTGNQLLMETELDADVPGGETHLLNVKLVDRANNCTSMAQIFVTVLDVNDNAPTFDSKKAQIKLAEDFPIHKPFYAVKATDRDRDENGQITYELLKTVPPSVPVQIHPNSGILSLSAPLDAEWAMFRNGSTILLHIRASDHGIPPRYDTMEVHVDILDVNDNGPLFDLPEYEIEVPEDADLMSVVHRLKATDADLTVLNKRIRYSIHQIRPNVNKEETTVAANRSSTLGINKWTGEIFLRELLDRERCAKYAFEVEARDSGIPSRSARVQLHMRVLDINDNAPTCGDADTQQRQRQQVVVVVVPHTQQQQQPKQQVGAWVGRVQATDPDEGPNGTVRFRMQQPNNEWFQLDATGDLYLQRPIDATTLALAHGRNGAAASPFPRSLILIAEDQSAEMPLSSVCQLVVVLDQNNTAEEMVGMTNAGDSGGIRLREPVQTELWLDGQTPVGSALVRVNATGVRRWSIRTSADDGHHHSHSSLFASLFSISGDGTIRLIRRPSGEEEGLLMRNPTQSMITVQMDSFDDNSPPKYLPFVLRRAAEAELSAATLPPLTVTVPLTWSLRSRRPLCMVEQKAINWTDQMFFRLEPVDEKSEQALQGGLFVLDELVGAVYLAQFPPRNWVDNGAFSFRIMANSLSDEQERTVQLVQIDLTNWAHNANRRRLQCANILQQWPISESAPIGTLVGRVNISNHADEDALQFFLPSADTMPFLRVDEFDGSVYLQKRLDRNAIPNILLAEVRETTTTTAQREGNGEQPTADTKASPPVLRCAISLNVQAEEDSVESSSSSNSKRNDLRFLSAPNVTIFVTNLEQGLYPGDNVVHHFVAVSSTSGSFSSSASPSFAASSPAAAAAAVGAKSGITFEISAGNSLGAFALKKNGALSVPDPSKIPPLTTLSRLTIRSNYANKTRREQHFVIRIDHSHRKFVYFARKHFSAEIVVGTSPLTKGQQQFVTNLKSPDTAATCVQFALLPPLDGFQIDQEEGSVKFTADIADPLLLNAAGHNLTLTVLAKRCATNLSPPPSPNSANGLSPLSTSSDAIDYAILTIVPRHLPTIAGPKIEPSSCGNVSVPENERISQLLRIRTLQNANDDNVEEEEQRKATPTDATTTAVVYAIEGGHWHNNLFTIDSGTGWLSSEPLDRENTPEGHLLMVSATDLHSVPKKADMCTVFITVIDRNDNAPKFDSTTADQLHLPETASVGHQLARLEAHDADEGQNGQVYYLMDNDPSGMFDIGWQSGEIIFAREPSSFLADQSGVWVVVKAVDKGSPNVLESEPKRIHISWDRRRTNNEVTTLAFARQTYIGNVPEGRPPGQHVAQLDLLNSRHNGSAAAGAVSFTILPFGNHDFAFRVDDNGRVSTALELDAEIWHHYTLQIVAVSSVNERHRTQTRLEVNVMDINDNAPFIAQDQQAAPIRLAESLPIGSLVTVLSATDADITPTQLEYSLGDLSAPLFEINRWNGKVHLKHKLDFETARHHLLRVYVTDGVNRATANLSVEVVDVNDNAPRFVRPYIETELSRDAPVGHLLARAEAVDADLSTNNFQIRYTIENDGAAAAHSPFHQQQNASSSDLAWIQCDPNSGELRLRNAFNERVHTRNDHFVVIKATDSGEPPLSAYCIVRIVLVPSRLDANKPIFDRQHYTFTLPENAPIHLPLGRLTMRQPLSNANPNAINCDFQLSTVPNNNNESSLHAAKFFRANFDGQIFVEDLLDRERHGEWLELEATVDSCPPRHHDTISTIGRQKVSVQIHLLDTNDNVPKFDVENNAKRVRISDSIKPGTVLTRFIATDEDASEQNSRVSYQLFAGDKFNQFSIGSASGELRFDRWNDEFALAQNDDDNDELPADELVILARDNGTPPQSAAWVVKVGLDSAEWSGAKPHFGVPVYRKFVPEDTPVGAKLFTVHAAAANVPRQWNDGTKERQIVARQQHQKQQQRHCAYAITEQPTTTTGAEAAKVADTLLMNDETLVVIDVEPTSGCVTLAAPVDFEAANISVPMTTPHQLAPIVRRFAISCTEPNGGKIVDWVPVEIRVFSVDEFAPTFTKNAYTFKLPSNFNTTKPIGQVVAIDQDIGYGSVVQYSMDQAEAVSAQLVHVNADNGILTMIRMPPSTIDGKPTNNDTFHGQQAKVLRFTVWAMSSGWAYGIGQHQKRSGARRSSATVYIEIGDSSNRSSSSLAAGDDGGDGGGHSSWLNSFDLFSLLVLPTLFLCFCLLSALVLARLLLRPTATKNANVVSFLRPAAPKKRMFSVATCRELQRHTENAGGGVGGCKRGAPPTATAAVCSPSVESGLFSYVKRISPSQPPTNIPQRERTAPAEGHARPPSSRSSASNYVNMVATAHRPGPGSIPGPGCCASRRSAPDSGIDPDARSLASEDSCAPANAFLSTLGIVEQIAPIHRVEDKRAPARRRSNDSGTKMMAATPPRDAFLDELIYACMDEIVPVHQQKHQHRQQPTRGAYNTTATSASSYSNNSRSSTFLPQTTHTAEQQQQTTLNSGRKANCEQQTPFLLTISKRLIEMEAQKRNERSENGGGSTV